MKNLKRALSLVLSTAMLVGMMVVGTGATSFKDVDVQDNLEAIEVLKVVGVMEGDDAGNFNPDELVTRNEMAVVMTNLLGLKAGGSHPFTDVPAWASDYVAACYANGTVAGTSATTFGGTQTVTAAQAALMVMKALGYFGFQGEFGEDWQLATIKMATKIDLFAGMNVYPTKALTRNEVAQLVLNALESTVMVVSQTGGMSVEGNGITVNQQPTYDYNTAARNNSGNNYDINSSNTTMQLVEKLFGNDLRKDSDGVDDFGRPANEWIYGTKSVKTAKAATLVYTEAVKGKTIYADLRKPTGAHIKDTSANTGKLVVDGVANQALPQNQAQTATFGLKDASGVDDDIKVGGNGTVVEVYYSKNTGETNIVVINSYVGEVANCEKNDDGKYDITLVEESKKFESAVAFEDEDIVVYTKTKTAGGATDAIKSMYAAKKITGNVSNVKNADSFTMDGTTYKYAAAYGTLNGAVAKLNASSVDFDCDVYVDALGYVAALDNTVTSEDYAVVIARGNGGSFGNDYAYKLLFADGTVEPVTVKKASYDASIAAGKLVTYTKDSDDIYTLSDVSDAALSADTNNALDINSGKATVKINNSNYTATAKTVFFFYDSNADEYNVYTGIKNVPSYDNGTTNYKWTVDAPSTLKAVYIEAAADLSDNETETAAFFYVAGDETLIKDTDLGNYYEVKAVIDGEAKTVKVDTNVYTNVLSASSQIVSKVKTNNDGVITNVTVETNDTSLDANGDGFKVNAATQITKAEDEVLKIWSTGYAYANDAVVYEYNTTDGAFVAKSIGALKTGAYNAFIQIDDSTVVAVYYIK